MLRSIDGSPSLQFSTDLSAISLASRLQALIYPILMETTPSQVTGIFSDDLLNVGGCQFPAGVPQVSQELIGSCLYQFFCWGCSSGIHWCLRTYRLPVEGV